MKYGRSIARPYPEPSDWIEWFVFCTLAAPLHIVISWYFLSYMELRNFMESRGELDNYVIVCNHENNSHFQTMTQTMFETITDLIASMPNELE